VQVVTSGSDALAQVRDFAPDHVLLDLGMPGMDGYEVARRIRASPLARQPRIIAVTGWGQDDDRERTLAAGFDGHLVKPASIHDVTQVLMDTTPPR
jgi:CheY-like chemotaxis protein